MINENLKQYLKDRKIKYKHLAEKVKMPYRAVFDMVKGRRYIKAEELFKICDILGITADELRNYRSRETA